MSISTTCSGCGASYTVSDALAGKKAKCKKCGAILTIPNPASELADVPLADLAAGTPLQGLDDRAFGGDPLGPSRPLGSLPSTASPRRAAAASQGAGVPKWVWIACGAGGGGVVLLLAILIFGGSSGGKPPAAQPAGADPPPGAPLSASGSPPSGAAPAPATTATTPATAASATTGTAAALVKVDDTIPWKFPAETLPTAPPGLLARPLSLTEGPKHVFLTAANVGQAVLAYESYNRKDVLVQRLDLKSGQTAGEHSFAQYTKLLAGSLDGTAVLLIPGDGYAAQERLQVWRWSGSKLQQTADWKPYESQSSKRIEWWLMLDANRVLTYKSQDDSAIAWDAAKAAPLFRLPCKSGQAVLLSAGGKYLVQHAGLWLRFLQAADGRHVASLGPLSDEYTGLSSVAVSPDGATIAACFHMTGTGGLVVALFDAAQGKLTGQIETPLLASPLQWVSPKFLLAGAYLISVEHAMTVWNYSGLSPAMQSFDPRVWSVVTSGSEHYLAASTVPSAEVTAKIDAYAAANTPVLKSGDTVSLQVTFSGQAPGGDQTPKLTESFRGKLTAAGYQIGDGQPYRLQVDVKEEDSGRQLEYQTFGGPGAGGKVQVPDRHVACKIAFLDSGGQVVWERSMKFGPAMMSFNHRGGSGDLVTQLLEGRWRSLDSWIQGTRLVKEVRRFSGTGKFGTSRLTPSGEQILSVPTP